MRRFSKAVAAAILLFTANGFAGYDDCSTTEFSDKLRLMELTCVACGVQTYYRSQPRGEVIPSEKWLAALAASARSFRELNPGEKGADSNSIVTKGTARQNMQRSVIAQIQAYGFCTQKAPFKNWGDIPRFITNKYNVKKEELTPLAKSLGFKTGVFSSAKARENFELLLNDTAMNQQTLDFKRQAFRENVNELLARKDVDDDLGGCLNEIKSSKVEQMNDMQSYNICTKMADSCDLEHDFCVRPGMRLTASPGSGSTQQGGTQQPPRPPAPQPLRRQLPPPPPSVQ